MAAVLSIKQRIEKSRRAQAIDRAWNAAKKLENRKEFERLRWVGPDQQQGMRRRIEFSTEFPDGVGVLMPVPIDINIHAPAKILVLGEDNMDFSWTMPILTRMVETEKIDPGVTASMGCFSPKLRPTIEVVSFLPFPRKDAPEDEQFKPEFFITLDIHSDLGNPDNYFCAVVRFGGKIIKQFVTSDRTSLIITADPDNNTLFRAAEMVAGLSAEQLAQIPENAGIMEIFVYRVAKRVAFDFRKLFDAVDIPAISDIRPKTFTFEPTRSSGGFEPTRSLDGGSPFRSPIFDVIPGGGQKPAPSSAPLEVSDVRLEEGTKGERARVEHISGYGFDSGFVVQPISIRFLGAREGAEEALVTAIEQV